MIKTEKGLPNSCYVCGTPIEASFWFAEHVDAARSGQGYCASCAENSADIAENGEAEGDDLTRINGIGRTKAKALFTAGFTTFQELAEANPNEVAEIGKTQMAIALSWQEQAAFLAAE